MNEKPEFGDEQLSRLLRAARPEPPLPPRFQDLVWQRIEQSEIAGENYSLRGLLERLLVRLLQPRLAMAGLVTLLIAGSITGAIQGTDTARQSARDRYLAAVAPATFH